MVSVLLADRTNPTAVFVSGYFDTAGGVVAHRIARWDGSQWSALGSGLSGDQDPIASALAMDSHGMIYAAGRFTFAGGVDAHNIARWDGQQWTPVGDGINVQVSALAIDQSDNLYAGTSPGIFGPGRVLRWDGQRWSFLGEAMNGSIRNYSLVIPAFAGMTSE